MLTTLPIGHAARAHHQAGVQRLNALNDWFDQLDLDDALSAWTSRSATLRMTFAAIHAGMVQQGPPT